MAADASCVQLLNLAAPHTAPPHGPRCRAQQQPGAQGALSHRLQRKASHGAHSSGLAEIPGLHEQEPPVGVAAAVALADAAAAVLHRGVQLQRDGKGVRLAQWHAAHGRQAAAIQVHRLAKACEGKCRAVQLSVGGAVHMKRNAGGAECTACISCWCRHLPIVKPRSPGGALIPTPLHSSNSKHNNGGQGLIHAQRFAC